MVARLDAAWILHGGMDFGGQLLASDPTILLEDGLYRLFYTEGVSDGATVRPGIAEAVSTDGVTWTQVGGNTGAGIVLSGTSVEAANLEGACIFKAGDTYVLLYSTYADVGDPLPQFPASLHAATSADGITFTPVGEQPVLSPTRGGYDNDAIYSPTVIRHGAGYLMIYCGHAYTDGSAVAGELGVSLLTATSPDGLTWTKGPARLLAGDASIPWMAGGVAEPSIVQGPDGLYYLFFTGVAGDDRCIGIAVASDPLGAWEVAPQPILTATAAGLGVGGTVTAPHAELVGGVLRLWYTKVGADGSHAIGYAEADWGGGTAIPAGGVRHWLGTKMDDAIIGGVSADRVTAGAGADLIATDGGDDTIAAGDGDDEVWAGAGNDDVSGGAGDDALNLEAGDDAADGGDGADIVSGGDGDDLLRGDAGADTLDGGTGDDRIEGGEGDDLLWSGGGSDTLDGGGGRDVLYGGQGNDTLIGGVGADLLVSGEDDTGSIHNLLRGDEGADTLIASAGADTLEGGADADAIYAGAGADLLVGGSGNDVLHGEDGDDRLVGGAGRDLLAGGIGLDTADYSASAAVTVALDWSLAGRGDALGDSLVGVEHLIGSGTGRDWLVGDATGNRIEGLGGNDTLDGGKGADTLFGGSGNDLFFVDQAGDVVIEGVGDGADAVHTKVNFRLGANLEILTASTGVLVGLTLIGNERNNVVRGGIGNDAAAGSAGNDALSGNGGSDTLTGDAGHDTLTGGDGNDRLLGGAGRDVFVFDRTPHALRNLDRLADYSPRDDTIHLEDGVFSGLDARMGELSAVAFRAGIGATAATAAAHRIIYDTLTGHLYYDTDGLGGAPSLHFATVENRAALSAADFSVI